MNKVKVVLIGAGSANFGRCTLVDLLSNPELREIELEVGLVDIDPDALTRMQKLAGMIKERLQSPATITAAVDRCEMLTDAGFVVTAVAVKRFQLWEQDFRVPLACGFRHVDGENGGPGAAFHTLRSLHQVVPICRDMDQLCPDALLLNFTNPESRVCLGADRLTGVRTVGLCHGAFSTLHAVADILDRQTEDTDITIGGINHFHWVLAVTDKTTDEDLTPAFHTALEQKLDTFHPTIQTMVRLFGRFPFPAPSHIAEYVAWGYEDYGMLWPMGNEGRRVGGDWMNYRRSMEAEAARVKRVAAGDEPLADDMLKTSGEIAVPIICDVVFDKNARELSVNIPNAGQTITNLPETAIVEIPGRVDRNGVRPEPVGALPEAVAALCRTQLTIQELLVQAYAEGSKDRLLQALVLDPVVDNVKRARDMMELLLDVEQDYLPELT